MYKMTIDTINDMAEMRTFETYFNSLEEVHEFVFPLAVDFAKNDYRVVIDSDLMEITSASTTFIYSWDEIDEKLHELANRPSPFEEKEAV